MTRRRSFTAAAIVLVLVAAGAEAAVSVRSGFSNAVVAGGLSQPTAMAFAPDGRLFVCQQTGALRIIKNGQLLSAPFVTVPVDPSGERGLLGVALDPQFAVNDYVYIYYTATTTPRRNRVSRFTENGDIALTGSEVVLLELNALSATNHNGGALNFGADGRLYVAVGDNANGSNAQTLSNLLGKILRIGDDGSIPADNPFFSTASGVNRAIWALGLRNPFRFTFQPGTGLMHIKTLYNPDLVQGWSPSNEFRWTPTKSDAGTHSFQVWVRAAGSSAAYDAWAPFGPVVIVP